MANLNKIIDNINSDFSILPQTYYHGRIGVSNDRDYIYSEISIREDLSDLSSNQLYHLKGRPYLDSAPHGFYLTPCEALARKWAYTQVPNSPEEKYQILVFTADTDGLSKLNGKYNIVPDSSWAEHIFLNRLKKIHLNEYDFVYNFIADGYISRILRNYEAITEHSSTDISRFHKEIMRKTHSNFVDDYYGKRDFKSQDIIRSCQLDQYKNYQMCISSNKALNCFKLIDIIEESKDIVIPAKLSVDQHLSDYKKYIPRSIISNHLSRKESE